MWYIHRPGSDSYIVSSIDSGGMSVFWVPRELADTFDSKEAAASLETRCKERYPNENFELVEYD